MMSKALPEHCQTGWNGQFVLIEAILAPYEEVLKHTHYYSCMLINIKSRGFFHQPLGSKNGERSRPEYSSGDRYRIRLAQEMFFLCASASVVTRGSAEFGFVFAIEP